MELAGQREAQRDPGSEGQFAGNWERDRVPASMVALVEAKQAARYWRSQHARAKQRIAHWQAECKLRDRALQQAQSESGQLRERVAELERDNAALQAQNQALLRSPFQKRSERRKRGQGGPGRAERSAAEAVARGAAGRPVAPTGRLGRPAAAGGSAPAARGPAALSGLRAGALPQRRAGQRARRSAGECPREAHPEASLAGAMRVRTGAGQAGAGGDRRPGARLVPGLALRIDGRARPVSDSVRYCGREFSPADLDRIRALIAQRNPRLSRTRLSEASAPRWTGASPTAGSRQ